MFEWLTSKPAAARQLQRDAVKIIETDQQIYSQPYLQRAASIVEQELAKIEQRLEGRPKDLGVVRYEVERRHREARRAGDGAALTALTLVLISLRANALGDIANPAKETIAAFIADPNGDSRGS
jgi:hypothetical protein